MSKINADSLDILRSIFTKKMSARYVGCLGVDNLGDELLFAAIRKVFPNVNFFGGYIGRFITTLENVFNYKMFNMSFLGGGTLINKKIYYDRFIESCHRYNYCAMLGVGVAAPYFWDEYGKGVICCDQWNVLLQGFDRISVRGPLSKRLLAMQGIDNVRIVGDPALLFAKEKITPKSYNKKIGINIGISNNMIWGGDEGQFLTDIIAFVNILLSEGYDIVFLPVWPEDLPYIEEAVKHINISTRIRVFEPYLDIQKTFDLLEDLDLFIGEKLHSVIMAACVNTPIIMLEYRPKCLDFMESIGLEDFNFRVNEIDFDEILTKMKFIYENMDFMQNKINTAVSTLKRDIINEAGLVMKGCVRNHVS